MVLGTTFQRYIVLLTAFLLFGSALYSQFTVTPVAFPGGSTLDISGYPTLKAQVRTTYKGQPVVLGANTVYLLETNVALVPESVTHVGNGVHLVVWKSIRFGEGLGARLIASYEGITASTPFSATFNKSKGGTVVVRDSMSRNIRGYIDFGSVAPGASDTLKLKVVATDAALDATGKHERPIVIESVTTTRPEVKALWKGSFGSGPLPATVISPLEYRIDLVCEPTTTKPLSDVLTITFEGGLRTTVIILANPPAYPRRTVLNVVYPNGGELVTPCQTINLRWAGMTPGFQAHAEYTVDNGKSWTYIDSTMDSSLQWEVPNTISSAVRIRVYQKFEAAFSQWLATPHEPALAAAFNANGRYLAAAFGNGDIVEYDAADGKKVGEYRAPSGTPPVSALCYVGAGRDILSLHSRAGSSGGTITKFNSGTSQPALTMTVDSDIQPLTIRTTSDGSVGYVLPRFASRIPSFNPANLESGIPIKLSATAASVGMTGSTLTVAFLDGSVVRYSAMTGAEEQRAQTGIAEALGPYASLVTATTDGRLVAMAGPQLVAGLNVPKSQMTYVYDMQQDALVRILHRQGSNVVNFGFSPSGSFLNMGFEFNPQLVVLDLQSNSALPPSGSSAGHSNKLSDIAFSPNGSSIVSASIDSTNNLLRRRVSVPETDASDTTFSIVPIQYAAEHVTLSPMYIGTSTDTLIQRAVCNTGTVPIIYTSVRTTLGKWLHVKNVRLPDTLNPGECLDLLINAAVADTGLLTDTVVLEACGARVQVPVRVNVADRNFEMLLANGDFGDLCVGSSKILRLAVLRNIDPVSVVINNVFVQGGLNAQYRIAEAIVDSVLPPGGTLVVAVEFVPRQLGLDTGIVIIRYAGQDVVRRFVKVTGRGSGALLDLSHTDLPFIPEIPVRSITVTNNNTNKVTIDSVSIVSGEPFSIVTPMPVELQPGQTTGIDVRYLGGTTSGNAYLQFYVQPCGAQNKVGLRLYSGSAVISSARITSDPRNDTLSIPVIAQINEQQLYAGQRFFEGKLRLHPRLFLARTITSDVGEVSIVSQEVTDQWRTIHFRIDGDFTGTAEIARLHGYAGMAEVDSCLIDFIPADGFGSAIPVTFKSGALIIQHPDPVRRIIRTGGQPVAAVVFPQPAGGHATVAVHTVSPVHVSVRLVGSDGNHIADVASNIMINRDAEIPISLAGVVPGLYAVEVQSAQEILRIPFVVVQ